MDTFGYKLPYERLMGGVAALRTEQMESINGFSNQFWGWGGEKKELGIGETLGPGNTALFQGKTTTCTTELPDMAT